MNMHYAELASQEQIDRAMQALRANGFECVFVANRAAAKAQILDLLPAGVEIMSMTSRTLEEIDIIHEINESGRFDAVRPKTQKLDLKTQMRENKIMRSVVDWTIGSAHAITEDGKIVIASNTGSQLPAYIYGADHVVLVIGAQKIVRDIDDAFKRLYEYTFFLEDERLRSVYHVGSSLNKISILIKEGIPHRTTVILVNEKLGF